ncbi:hypothetical protein GCM10022207_63240 [Streptomyces lannensis]|uniref:Uncharacterized protein n=1 Tax=Streptomyces lannensis TaxID=766498 RepID=A0ABP7KT45_9ACTN
MSRSAPRAELGRRVDDVPRCIAPAEHGVVDVQDVQDVQAWGAGNGERGQEGGAQTVPDQCRAYVDVGHFQCHPAYDARRRERPVDQLTVTVARREVHEGLPREVRKCHLPPLRERMGGAQHRDERHSGQFPCLDPGGLAFG